MNAKKSKLLRTQPEPGQNLAPEVRGSFHESRQTIEAYHSLLPSAKELTELEGVVPGAAKQYLDSFHAQSEHRRTIESRVVDSNLALAKSGQLSAFLIAIAVLASATWLIHEGHQVSGTILGSMDLVALVSVFIYGKSTQTSDLEAKDETRKRSLAPRA